MYPSGAALATRSTAIRPAAPGRGSMTTGCPSASSSRSAKTRAIRSLVPPSVDGSTMRMGRFGYFPASIARVGRTNHGLAAIAHKSTRRRRTGAPRFAAVRIGRNAFAMELNDVGTDRFGADFKRRVIRVAGCWRPDDYNHSRRRDPAMPSGGSGRTRSAGILQVALRCIAGMHCRPPRHSAAPVLEDDRKRLTAALAPRILCPVRSYSSRPPFAQ